MVFIVWILTVLIAIRTRADYVAGKETTRTSDLYSTPPSRISVTGRLIINKHTGVQHSRHRHDMGTSSPSTTTTPKHNLSLHLDDGSPPLYMEVGPGSVWGPRSILQARWGRHRLRFKTHREANDASCYLYGYEASKDGSVSIQHCGRLNGQIYLPDHHLELEELEHSPSKSSGTDGTDTKVKVVKTKVNQGGETLVDGVDAVDKMVKKFDAAGVDLRDSAIGMAMDFPEVTIEVALFADARYMAHLYDLGYDTTRKALGWFITKWNTIQGVYTNTKKTGVSVRFKLVKIELWWYDPADYPSPTADEASRLDWFCRNTPQGDGADQKVLYTIHTGSTRYNGWTNVGKTCVHQQNCYLVKSPTLGASVELHEMGHSFGILHDNQMEGCNPPQGFMGPGLNYLFKICYRTSLQQRLRVLDCLYREDFKDREHIESFPYWIGLSGWSPKLNNADV